MINKIACFFVMLLLMTACCQYSAVGLPSSGEQARQARLYDRLSDAAYFGSYGKVKMLLAQGADPNTIPSTAIPSRQHNGGDRLSPLEAAVCSGECDIILLLLANGADLNRPGPDGETALFKAGSSPGLTAFLLDHGADIHATDSRGQTPLHDACCLVNERNLQWLQTIALLLVRGSTVDARDFDGATPLMLAAETESTKTMEMLIAHGADVNATDKAGKTPLMYAANFFNAHWHESKPHAAWVLLRHHVDVNAQDHEGNTALMWLAQTDDERGQLPDAVQFAKMLRRHGARTDLRNRKGRTAREIAEEQGWLDLILAVSPGPHPRPLSQELERGRRRHAHTELRACHSVSWSIVENSWP